MRSSLMCPSLDYRDHDAPDVRVIWDKTRKAQRAHLCAHCNEEIAPGQVYESRGYYLDGEFKTEKSHRFAFQYPSGCPRFWARDEADARADDSHDDNPAKA